jgi:Concanavalin A-like lectin/glucanases superfamily
MKQLIKLAIAALAFPGVGFVRPTAHAQTCVPPPPGLVAWYPGDGNANDIQGGNNGTLQNGATFAPGEVGQAFSLDGVEDSVLVTQTPATDSEITMDAWINPASLSGRPIGPVVFEKGAQVNNRVGLQISSDGQLCGYVNSDTFNVCSAINTIPTGTFTHVALVVSNSAGAMRLYANGALVAKTSGTDTLHAGTAALVIGDSETSGIFDNFGGIIDEVEVFNRALDASEIQAIVNAGSAGKCKPSNLLNISTRLNVQTGDNVLIGGFIITGTNPKKVIVRGIGPSLGLQGVLADPTLELHEPDGTVVTNDNWRDTQEQEIIDTTIPPTNDLESAIVATLDPGAYTIILAGKNDGSGVGLVEAYDLDQAADSKLANISTRGFVETNDNVMIGGFIIGGGGGGARTIVGRAIGPSLTDTGVASALQDPTLELHDSNGALIASNDNWRTDQEAEIIATTIPPTNDLESAIVRDLTPGAYTAIVSGVNSTTGVALVEVYALY